MEHTNSSGWKEVIKSAGIVFGDIGTSPLYTLTVIFSLIPVTPGNIIGVVSLIIWTLITLVTIQYAWLAMSLSLKGEGGTIVLKEILTPLLTSRWKVAATAFLTFLGISLFIGDGVITPAISVLSAIEGLAIIPGLQHVSQTVFILIACCVTIGLFMIQRRGTEQISLAFGPIMVVWFLILGISGVASIIQYPAILQALNPWYGISLLLEHGWVGFFLLSTVILCATGAEAMYADMGHLGREPIVKAWYLVFICLALCYMGQGVFKLQHPQAQNIFYEMIFAQSGIFYIPILLLSVMATVIASQAMLSGIFSVVYQGITTRIMPRMNVEYTSRTVMSQIYIPAVNWFLMICVLLAIINFKYSANIANAYGLAASGTMTITAFMVTAILYANRAYWKALIALLVFGIDLAFLAANLQKIPHGGYWSLLFASIPFTIIIIYIAGQKKLYSVIKPLPLDEFLHKYEIVSPNINHIDGTAVFFSRDNNTIPSYIAYTMFTNTIVYEDNVMVNLIPMDTPFGILADFDSSIETIPGIRFFKIKFGYMEHVDIASILTAADIYPKVMFYGLEDVSSNNFAWRIFILIKKLSPSFVQFHQLTSYKLHGVVVRAEM